MLECGGAGGGGGEARGWRGGEARGQRAQGGAVAGRELYVLLYLPI